jgi:hypothetical protein
MKHSFDIVQTFTTTRRITIKIEAATLENALTIIGTDDTAAQRPAFEDPRWTTEWTLRTETIQPTHVAATSANSKTVLYNHPLWTVYANSRYPMRLDPGSIGDNILAFESHDHNRNLLELPDQHVDLVPPHVSADLLRIRSDPSRYVPSLGIDGLVYLAQQCLDDAMTAKGHTRGVVCLLCKDTAHYTYQLVVWDGGGGIPANQLIDAYTRLDVRGPMGGKQTGPGTKIAVATSRQFSVINSYAARHTRLSVNEGRMYSVTEHFYNPGLDNHGIVVVYEPDPLVMAASAIERFAEVGFRNLFSAYPLVEFRTLNRALPATIWNESIIKTTTLLDKYLSLSVSAHPPPNALK